MKLSIIIPVYNEALTIERALNRIIRYFDKTGLNYDILIVDDGSKDNTVPIVLGMSKDNSRINMLRNKRNMGKGQALKNGMLAATGDYILFTDADLSTPLSSFENFRPYIDSGWDVIIGSRWLDKRNVKIRQPIFRRMLAHVFYFIIHMFFIREIKDTNCGFKCFRKEVAKDVFSKQRINGWGFDAEILYISSKHDYRIKEVPVKWAHSRKSKVNMTTVPLKTLKELAQIKFNEYKGYYN